MGSHSESPVSNVTEVSTTNIADSYNDTVNKVLNLSEVGNVSVGEGSMGNILLILPLVAGLLVIAIGLSRKKG